jgi:hypothetical protein
MTETFIALTRCTVNSANPAVKAARIGVGEKKIVAKVVDQMSSIGCPIIA